MKTGKVPGVVTGRDAGGGKACLAALLVTLPPVVAAAASKGELYTFSSVLNTTSLEERYNCSGLECSLLANITQDNSTNGTELEGDHYEPLSDLILMGTLSIILGLMILVTVIGNVFVIAAILLERNLQNVANYLIVSLAVADLMVACLVMPLGAVYVVEIVRSQYRADAKLSAELNIFQVYAADLQKVFLLPRMPNVKDSFFTSRLVVFNETFAAMAKKYEHYCVLWHEAIAERRAEDIASSFLKFLQCNRDAEHVILWLDNCSGQNKNNILISAILSYINSDLCTTKSISLKYLISGHTYMAADGLHGKIEQAVRRMGNVEDFPDFRECCKKASSRMNIVEMQYNDFLKIENKLQSFNRKNNSEQTPNDQLPYFKDIVALKFIKGSECLYVRTDYDGNYNCISNVLKKNASLLLPQHIQAARGICTAKKETIVNKLVPKMMESRRPFWINLPDNNNARDLLNEGI